MQIMSLNKIEKVENNVDTSSHYLWNRIKVRFGLLDDWLIDVLVM